MAHFFGIFGVGGGAGHFLGKPDYTRVLFSIDFIICPRGLWLSERSNVCFFDFLLRTELRGDESTGCDPHIVLHAQSNMP